MPNSILKSVISILEDTHDLVHHQITDGISITEMVLAEQKGENRAILFEGSVPLLTNVYNCKKRILNILETEADIQKYNAINLSDLPILKHHSDDVSGSINLGCVISSAGSGIYRIQPLSDKKAIIHCYPTSKLATQLANGLDVPVAIAIGTHPEFVLKSAVSGIEINPEIPDGTEIIIKGTVSAHEKHVEGPFQIYTGTSKIEEFPVMRIESVMAVQSTTYQTIITGKDFRESLTLIETAKELFQNKQ